MEGEYSEEIILNRIDEEIFTKAIYVKGGEKDD